MIKTTAAIKAYKKCRICGFTTTDDSICSCKRCKSYLYTYSGMYVPKIAKNKRCTKVHLLDHITLKREHEPIT